MKYKIYIIDAFTDRLFSGNPAAVILLSQWIDEGLMQSIAAENNLSETAFVVEDKRKYYIRWFSPLKEIDFCGHATLASAYVLFQKHKEKEEIAFYAKDVGDFLVNRLKNDMIEMHFPARKPHKVEDVPSWLYQGLSIKPVDVYRNQQAYFAIYENEEDIYAVMQETEIIKKLSPYDVVVTAPVAVTAVSKTYDFVSRYFWPASGGAEDPVTGSIHTGLAPFWGERLGKQEMIAYQASSRGGILYCSITEEMVSISGKAVRYMEGIIDIG